MYRYEELLCDSDADGSDADNEMEVADNKGREAKGHGGKQARGKTFIQEDQDEALDLLDPRSSNKIRTSLPKGTKKSLEHSFPKSEDGRLFIEDDEEIAARAAAEQGDGITFGRGIHRDRVSERTKRRRPWGQEEEESDSEDEKPAQQNRAKKVRPMGAEFKAKVRVCAFVCNLSPSLFARTLDEWYFSILIIECCCVYIPAGHRKPQVISSWLARQRHTHTCSSTAKPSTNGAHIDTKQHRLPLMPYMFYQ